MIRAAVAEEGRTFELCLIIFFLSSIVIKLNELVLVLTRGDGKYKVI